MKSRRTVLKTLGAVLVTAPNLWAEAAPAASPSQAPYGDRVIVTVVLENEKLRASRVAFEPGGGETPHTHDWDLITVALTPADLEITRGTEILRVQRMPGRGSNGSGCRRRRSTSAPGLSCAGFQHALLEYARDVWGLAGAVHAEPDPGAADPVIAPLAGALVERTGRVRFTAGSRLRSFCAAAEVRSVELSGHPFFIATLYQPERAALAGRVPPLVAAFVAAAAGGSR